MTPFGLWRGQKRTRGVLSKEKKTHQGTEGTEPGLLRVGIGPNTPVRPVEEWGEGSLLVGGPGPG